MDKRYQVFVSSTFEDLQEKQHGLLKATAVLGLLSILAYPAAATLIVIVPTGTGLIACADKRSWDRIRGDHDDLIKISPIGASAACGSTGDPTFLDGRTLTVLFSADAVTKAFFKSRDLQSVVWNDYGNALSEGFKAFLRRLEPWVWPETADSPDNSIFQTVVFYLDSAGYPHVIRTSLMFRNGGPEASVVSFKMVDYQDAPVGLGNLAVWNEISEGHNPAFDEDRKNPIIRRFVGSKPPFSRTSVTNQQGLMFANTMIRVTSRKTHLLESSSNHVGPTCDCALIDQERGFRWVTQRRAAQPSAQTTPPKSKNR
jgi:hypothetical protein